MSTIRHTVAHHTTLYAAAALVVLAGLLAVLVAQVFAGSGSVGTPQDPPVTAVSHGHAYGSPCFAGRPGTSPDLIRFGCRG